MKLTLEEMKCEAVKRLEILNSLQPIEDLVINEFKEKGSVVYSEINYFNGLKIPTNFSLDTQSKVEDLKDIKHYIEIPTRDHKEDLIKTTELNIRMIE